MLLSILAILAFLLATFNTGAEFHRDLMMLQQNSYRPDRYFKWLSESGDSTSVIRLSALVIFFIGLYIGQPSVVALTLIAVFAIFSIVKLLKAKYKKPLVWTKRAIRIYATTALITIALAVAAVFLFDHSSLYNVANTLAMAATAAYCASHILIIAAVYVLQPVEKLINRKYYNQARDILRQMPDLKIVGITGSYGKTSTKHYLYRILSEKFDTAMTPGSFNTTLGVVRTIREYLKPYNEVFIVEMGAKAPGDIKEICDLVHPQMGIITAVGPQHLESFKTIEAVQATKFELADALPADGLAIVNDDFEKIADRPVENTNCVRYGVQNEKAEFRAENVKYTASGTSFTVKDNSGWSIDVTTRLLGECNVSDLVAAIVAAHRLGVPDSKIISAVSSIDPVEHRLSIKTTPGGIVILDDAFNSNPVGSKMALDVLGAFDSGKRIIITPGMIELGDEQVELNKEFGRHIARNADIAIIVGKYNRDAIVDGISESGLFVKSNIHTPDTFAQAQQILAGIAAKGDVVLYENDLPDTFK